MKRDQVDTPNAIPPGTDAARLTALARRLGGNTTPVLRVGRRVVLPTITHWGHCEDQLDLFDDTDDDDAAP